jgi:transcription elongation GreA/GreB family factor
MAKSALPRPTPAERYVLSAAARARVEAELADLDEARNSRACEQTDLCGDAADIAELALRDMALERYDERIGHLRALLAESVSATQESTAQDDPATVRLGVVINLRFAGATETERFVVGDIAERDDAVEVITPASPLGRALIGARQGEQIRWAAPRGTITAAIVDVAPLTDLRAS